MLNRLNSFIPECMIVFRNEEEPRLRRWLADHGIPHRNETAGSGQPGKPNPDQPLPMNRLNSIFIWSEHGGRSFTGMPLYVASQYAHAYPECVFSVDEFLSRENE